MSDQVVSPRPGAQVQLEMAEQPEVLARIVGRRTELHELVRSRLPSRLRGISLIARGSSDNVAVHARYLLELATGLPVSLIAPSIITRYHHTPDSRDHLVVALSQSGKTPEIVDVARRLADGGGMVVAVTNDDDSPLAAAATVTLAVGTGRELAVPATKTVTGQLALVTLLAEAVGSSIAEYTGGESAWAALPDAAAQTLADERLLAEAVAVLQPRGTAIHLARGLTYCAALEGALKSKETSRRVHEGFSSADFLHGPLTVASDEVAVVAYGARGPVLADVAETARAAAELGSPVIGVGAPEVWNGVPGAIGLAVPQTLGEALAVIPLVIRGQQLAIATTLALGLDPDRPAGLNKVTATH
ncbi:glutamine--fructose-6-phosphate transaminase [Nakamurella panacisegetis]|uniref:Glutamine--fructose-6-phosphate transaminase n=1 Tax=Nakamurella panacisegetis TaxID=1090615 RepID=A0A1H0HQS3_9ACTN|nr:SIS domain-containing protein [Nakamurella panacisegetis]SDO21420.1 glutamine--fructose-6-phosphate transaminase [Nakamurella panacisegetis]